ncbi:MAG: hypothetical protein D3920_16765 [Candidatus Electrothrix sp. AW2]|nr:hypothetical protein [Candidatus Electrothrix gigas]
MALLGLDRYMDNNCKLYKLLYRCMGNGCKLDRGRCMDNFRKLYRLNRDHGFQVAHVLVNRNMKNLNNGLHHSIWTDEFLRKRG